jgi:hypothetical protein
MGRMVATNRLWEEEQDCLGLNAPFGDLEPLQSGCS